MSNYVNDQVDEVVCNLNAKVNNSIEEFILAEINQANLDENIEVNIQKILEAMRANQTEESIRADERKKVLENFKYIAGMWSCGRHKYSRDKVTELERWIKELEGAAKNDIR